MQPPSASAPSTIASRMDRRPPAPPGGRSSTRSRRASRPWRTARIRSREQPWPRPSATDRALLDADLSAFNVDAMDGPQVELLNIPSFQPTASVEDGAALLARWRQMPRYLDQAIARSPPWAGRRPGWSRGRLPTRPRPARRAPRSPGRGVAAGRARRGATRDPRRAARHHRARDPPGVRALPLASSPTRSRRGRGPTTARG